MTKWLNYVQQQWRLLVVALFLLLLFAALIGRMLVLQVLPVEGGVEFLQGQGDARVLREEKVPATRGMITDRNGQPLAVSTPVVSIWANPQKVVANKVELKQLAKKLSLSVSHLEDKLKRYKDKRFVYLKRHVSPEFAQTVFDLGLSGIYGENEYRRFFPAGEVTSHLIGYTDVDNHGQEGFEYSYDKWLQGEMGSKLVVKDLFQRTIKNVKQIKEPKQGHDLALSIDLRLQYLAFRELKEAVTRHRADAGSIVVLDVKTGEVLAMVNQPAFNPNDRSVMDIDAVRNRAVTDMFEPGSTVKPITTMVALESGKYLPETVVNTHPGYIKVGRKTLLDPRDYGELTVKEVLAKSSQVGTTKIALSLDQEQLHEAFFRLGLGQFVGTGFPGEGTGYLPNHSNWQPIEKAAFAFGAGLSVTALQMAQAYSVFANEGLKRNVSLVKLQEPVKGEQIVDKQVAKEVKAMLAGVTGKKGTAKKANTEHYSVAGKTGTSHKVGRGGYESGRYISLFAGFAPAENPRLVAVVVIDDPKGKEYYGGEVAAPVFAELMSDSLRILNVTPDKIEANTHSQWVAQQ
jgi:cell division protein FtsI (penicillin-binding protein 3)